MIDNDNLVVKTFYTSLGTTTAYNADNIVPFQGKNSFYTSLGTTTAYNADNIVPFQGKNSLVAGLSIIGRI